jgi:hypothetical protein
LECTLKMRQPVRVWWLRWSVASGEGYNLAAVPDNMRKLPNELWLIIFHFPKSLARFEGYNMNME